MEKLLSLFVVCALVGCAEADNGAGTTKKPDSGKFEVASDEDTGIVIPMPDSSSPGDDSTAAVDTGGGGGCTVNPGATSKCGTFPQCGCTGSQNCDVTSTDGSATCKAAGTTAENDKCTGYGQCQKGHSCVGSLCRAFCASDSDCGGGKCKNVQADDGAGGSIDVPGMMVCFTQCDPRSPSGACGSGKGCAFLSEDGTTACTAAGSAKGTGTCASDPNACAPGYGCIGTAGDCLQWCRVGFASDCSGGGTCTSFSTPVMKDGTEYGVCVI